MALGSSELPVDNNCFIVIRINFPLKVTTAAFLQDDTFVVRGKGGETYIELWAYLGVIKMPQVRQLNPPFQAAAERKIRLGPTAKKSETGLFKSHCLDESRAFENHVIRRHRDSLLKGVSWISLKKRLSGGGGGSFG